MSRNLASIYPTPYDLQLRHEYNSSIYCKDQIYSYEEGKLTTIKNDGTAHFPEKSLLMGFKELKILPKDINLWILPIPKKKNILGLYLFFSTFLKAYKGSLKNFKGWSKKRIKFVSHHDLHTYTAIGSSRFRRGVYLNIDGGGDLGDQRNFTWGIFKNNKIKEYQSLKGLNSIACFHAFITEFCGFRDQNGKTSGLSAYGSINYELKKKLEKVLIISKKGIYFLRERRNITEPTLKNINIDNYDRTKIFKDQISKTNIFEICKGYLPQDVAITAEKIISEQIVKFLRMIKNIYFKKFDHIIFSGGLFLNVKINSDIENSKIFKKCFFTMAPSDSGLSLGGIFSENIKLKKDMFSKLGLTPFLGPSFSEFEINKLLKNYKLNYSIPKNLEKDIAQEISKKKIIGLFQGKAEFGQRSLGNRSILADPRWKKTKEILNQKIKKRDWFMPFAPAILDTEFKNFFNSESPSLYMQKAEKVIKSKISMIPAAVHYDHTSRVQYVDRKLNKKFWNIIKEFQKITKIPIILNTSFNRHGISTISTPRQAIDHLLEGCIDVLYLEKYKIEIHKNRIINKRQEIFLKEEYLLKKNNLIWLKNNRSKMNKKNIKMFEKNIRRLKG